MHAWLHYYSAVLHRVPWNFPPLGQVSTPPPPPHTHTPKALPTTVYTVLSHLLQTKHYRVSESVECL